ncbi:hypothetical protein A2U01_0107749, partial [Trifolium medium]|nr:hypothetical protein [Trifolium medium]
VPPDDVFAAEAIVDIWNWITSNYNTASV